MRVWVTSTEPGASRCATALTARGFAVFKAPALHIERLPSPPPSGRFDLVLFVSENAVSSAAANGWPDVHWRHSPTAAIGAAAEVAMRAHDVEPCMPWLADAAAVVHALAPPPRTLIVKGEGGRDVVQRWLRARHREVVEWNVYRRLAAAPPIGGERIDAIVAASGDGLGAIAQLWFACRRPAGVPLLAPSARVAELAREAGFKSVIVTPGANATAVATALAEIRDEGRYG